MKVLRLVRDVLSELVERFVAFGQEADRRSRAGEFGKWPWQEDYGLWPWQRRRKGRFCDRKLHDNCDCEDDCADRGQVSTEEER